MTKSNRERWLAEPEWLAAHLDDPAIRVVDMRGAVRTITDEDGVQHALYTGLPDEYRAGHIPGAVFVDWASDIVDPDDPVPAQAAPPERIAELLSGLGIGDQTTVVAYDNHPTGQFATRLWWLLRYYGHEQAMVLDGGLARWQREGRPLSIEEPSYEPARFTPRINPTWCWPTRGRSLSIPTRCGVAREAAISPAPFRCRASCVSTRRETSRATRS